MQELNLIKVGEADVRTAMIDRSRLDRRSVFETSPESELVFIDNLMGTVDTNKCYVVPFRTLSRYFILPLAGEKTWAYYHLIVKPLFRRSKEFLREPQLLVMLPEERTGTSHSPSSVPCPRIANDLLIIGTVNLLLLGCINLGWLWY